MIARSPPRFAAEAPWALRFALLPLPLLILAAVFHRYQLIELTPLFVVIALAWVMAAVALFLAARAFRTIWWEGSRGLKPALAAAVLAVVVLALPAAILVEMVVLPRISDVSTDGTDPPLFTAAPDEVVMRPVPGDAEKTEQASAYPDIVPRHYPLSPERVFQSIDQLVAARGWGVTDRRAPDTDNEVGWIEATAATPGFSLPVDVVIRIVEDDRGTLVDMRSASRIGAHDLGDNARRIRGFFTDLDAALQGVTETTETAGPDAESGADLPPLPTPPPVNLR